MTLTYFLTTFIYYPLLKSLKKINFLNTMIVTFCVFLIAGIWHGPSWNFILFGAFHGFGLTINHIYKRYFTFNISKFILWFLTFNFINISFIFFRTKEIENIILILKKMFDIKSFFYSDLLVDKLSMKFFNDINLFICFLLSIVICMAFKNSYGLVNKR